MAAQKLIEWNGEKRSVSGWARYLRTTRDKIRTRHAKGLRLDADSIDGIPRPLKHAPRKKPQQGRPPRTAPPLPPAMLIAVLRAMGYTAEPTTIDGEEVLLVRGPV